LDEDKEMRKDRWNEFYENRRVIFWDTRNVRLTYKPSSSDAQRNTYSVYYSGNVAKGGIFIQPSGWMGASELFVGAVSDTDYITKAKILEKQQTFLNKYDEDRKSTTWTLI
jgi:hypothetical protein